MTGVCVTNVRELLENRVRSTPDKDFLFDESSGRVYKYADFDRLVDRTANLLVSLGAKKGDRVSLFLTNRLNTW